MNRTRQFVSALVATIANAAISGCQTATPQPAFWIVDSGSHLSDSASIDPDISGISPRRADLIAAMNETVGFLFALRAGQGEFEYPELRASDLTAFGARLSASAFEIFRVHPVHLTDFPGWHIRSIPPALRDDAPLDVLIPLGAPRGGLPRSLEPGVTYFFWVDVSIPKGVQAAEYASAIQVFSRGVVVADIPVRLRVLPLVLPDSSEPPAIAEVDHVGLIRHHVRPDASPSPMGLVDWRDMPWGSRNDALIASTMSMLQRHRLTPVLHKLSPLMRVSSRGELDIDWTNYDNIVDPLLHGRAFFSRVPLQVWPLPLHAVFSAQSADLMRWTPGTERLVKEFIRQCASHFEEKGWLDRVYALPPSTESTIGDAIQAELRMHHLIHSADKRIPVASRLFPQDLGPYGWVDFPKTAPDDDIKVWIPTGQFFDPKVMAAERDKGRQTWLAADRPPYTGSTSVYAPPSYVDVLSWQCRSLGAQALWIGCINNWPDDPDAGDPESCARFDANALLYPGQPFGLDEPVVTMRLKRLRASSQDSALASLLEQHGLGDTVRSVQNSLIAYAGAATYRTHFADGRAIGWTDSPAAFELARRIMADEMVASLESVPSDPRTASITRDVQWSTFQSMTRRVTIRIDGSRMRWTGTPGDRGIEVETWFTVTNRSGAPLRGTVSFADLPEGWISDAGPQKIDSLPSNDSRIMVATYHREPASLSDRQPQNLTLLFTPNEGPPIQTPVGLAHLIAEPIFSPPSIEGDLSDWPPGAINVAANLELIAGDCSNRDDRATTDRRACARPAHRTFGFALRDDTSLYLAINAEAQPSSDAALSRRRGVQYEDMIPMDDEDLVEVLIDPLNGGTRSPSDLFHIVIKRSGVYLAEQGIAFDPPCGTRRIWPADIDVATRDAPDRWMAELRIPLSAFGHGEAHGEIWGFNITRLDAASREFSTWSGAVENAYDPLSLGNLILP